MWVCFGAVENFHVGSCSQTAAVRTFHKSNVMGLLQSSQCSNAQQFLQWLHTVNEGQYMETNLV